MFDFHGDRVSVEEVTDRFAELRDERDGLQEAVTEAEEARDDAQTDVTFASHGDGDTTGELGEALATAETELQEARNALELFNTSGDGEELRTLESVLDDLRGYGGNYQFEGEWFPDYLIADSDFEDYARELAEDIGAIPDDAQWPCTCIDWKKAARELQMDYTSVTIEGRDYWYR